MSATDGDFPNHHDDLLRAAIDGTRDGTWDWNIVTGEVAFNEHWSGMLGYAPGEIEPHVRAWEALVHPDDMPLVQRELNEHLEGRAAGYSCEHRLRARSGEWVWVLDRGRVVERDSEGRPLRAAGTHVDITQRRRAEIALAESEARYRGLVESQRDLIVRVDAAGRFTFVNDAYCAMFGKSRAELLGSSYAPLVHPDDLPRTLAAMQDLLAAPHRVTVEQRALTARGWRWLTWEDDAILDDGGAIAEIQAIGRDITERKLLEEQLLAQRDLAQRAAEARTLQEMLAVCLDIAVRAGQMDCALIVLADESGTLDLAAARGFAPGMTEPLRAWARRSENLRRAASGQPAYYSGVPETVPEQDAALFEGMRAVAVLPVAGPEQSVGALLVGSYAWDEVPELARPTLETIVLQTASHIRRIQEDEASRRNQRDLEDRLRKTNRTLEASLGELKQYAYESRLLSEMASLLQVCLVPEEAYQVVERQLGLLFPAERGALHVVRAEQSELVAVAHWGVRGEGADSFAHVDCWGLRRGAAHLAVEGTLDLRCAHLGNDTQDTSLCVPLVAQGETLGLLHVRSELTEITPAKQDLAQMVADKIALALSNMSLRDTLRQQSIRDPLTGLYNRRFLVETLRQQLARNTRAGRPVALVMLDVDHFKRLNDTRGHDAGDAALRELAALLGRTVREGDIACRYGGEEFLLVLPDATLEAATRQAERVCAAVRELRVVAAGKPAGPITISAGVACSPEHGATPDVLLRAADAALYAAKSAGRDRVCIAWRAAGEGGEEPRAKAA